MTMYSVRITEILSREVSIEAGSPDEAIDQVREKYQSEQIVLNEDDYVDTDIELSK